MITEEIRSLSWREPYGTLMLPPFNKIETRSRKTNYRGLVLLCGSLKPYPWDIAHDISGKEQFDRILQAVEQRKDQPGVDGQAFAVGRLVDCRRMTKADEDQCFVEYRDPWFVTNKKGQRVLKMLWCYVFDDVRSIKPFAWKGSQGLRRVPQDKVCQIEYCE